jgi:Holliday junction resolvasome RuvABC ATP-dependent DNA helicase subunit
MSPFGFGRKEQPQSFTTNITDKEDLEEIREIAEMLNPNEEVIVVARQSSDRCHIMLTGPPACAKSLFMLQIEKFMSSKVYFAEGAATTKAGLQKFIAENPHKEILIIDEIDKMPLQHQEGLLTMMERGEFVSTKVRNTRTVRANIVIFATSNGTERLSKPLLSRFTEVN